MHFLIHLVARAAISILTTLSFSAPGNTASVRDAVALAIQNNPQILEAAANRRAVDEELNQGRGLYLPRLDLEASAGFAYNHRPTAGVNQDSRWGDSGGLVARQTLFDGGYRQAEVEKQSARVVGAAIRVRERSELIAIETLQSYIDVSRFNRILRLSEENIRIHRDLVALVQTRTQGGASTQGEAYLARERLFAAEAIRADIKRTLGLAEARYINLVGVRHTNLELVPKPNTLPGARDTAIRKARDNNPTLHAADKDVAAARADFTQSEAAFRPNVALEGRGAAGHDLNGIKGPNNDASAKLVMSWNLFNGHIDQARRREKAERLAEVESRLDRLRRDVDEGIMRAWSDIQTNDERVSVLDRQIDAGKRLTVAYRQEFDGGRRSMLDLLEAQNVHFNAQIQRITASSLALYSRYQLIAVMGGLLEHFRLATNVETEEDLRPWTRDAHDRPSMHPLLRR